MKKLILILSLMSITPFLFSQYFRIGITPSLNYTINHNFFTSGPYEEPHLGFGINTDYFFNTKTHFNLGVGFGYHFDQALLIIQGGISDSYSQKVNMNVLSLNIKSNYYFKNEYYLSLIPSFDFQLKPESDQAIDNQSGIGFTFGIGKNFKINETLFLNIEPNFIIRNIIPFYNDDLSFRFIEAKLNIGLVFRKAIQ